MEQQLRCYTSETILSIAQVDALLRHPVPERWGSARPGTSVAESWNISCAMAIDPDSLHFVARIAGKPHRLPQAKPHSFTHGLWEADVVELFLVEGRQERYYEFNLAADGAWWAQGFLNCRTPDSSYRVPTNVQTDFFENDDDWGVRISVPRNELANELSFTPTTRANFCGILGDSPRHYFSLAPITTAHPDFHQSKQFLPLKLAPLG